MYIKSSIPFTVLEDPEDEKCSFEVLWIKMHPTRLPRGISSIIAGVVYHPPKATNSMMLDYLTKCLMDLESKYSNCGILVLEDLNHLNDAGLKTEADCAFSYSWAKHSRQDSYQPSGLLRHPG